MHAEHPELVKDQFWDEVTRCWRWSPCAQGIPDELPYTVAAEEFRTDPWLGSTADVLINAEQVGLLIISLVLLFDVSFFSFKCFPFATWLNLQGEFVNLDKIDEEDLDPDSDDELNQIRIEDVKPTVPVNITKNGGLMTIGSESSIQVRQLVEKNKSWTKLIVS